MDLLVIYEKVEGTKNTYHPRYELFPDRKSSLMRKEQLLSLSFVRNVEIISIEMSRMFSDVSEV